MLPLAISYANGYVLKNRENINLIAPFPDSYREYVEGEFAFYDPGKTYFENLFDVVNIERQRTQYKYDEKSHQIVPVKIDQEYQGNLNISIPAIGIKNIKISPNVESYHKDVYNLALKDGVAHFKGTPVPGDGGNSFIYGHSAVPSFFSRHKNLPETIFTKLENAEVGNTVVIERDGVLLNYRIIKKKIIEADDYTIFDQIGNKETVTLMTCWPTGIGSKRLIVIAEKYDNE